MTLTAKTTASNNFSIRRFLATAARLLAPLSRYYSQVLGTDISLRQTLLLLNAQLAALFTIFPVACPLLLRLACLAWLVSALLKCRDCGIRTSR